MSEVSSAVTLAASIKQQLSWLLMVPVVIISMKELLYSKFTEATSSCVHSFIFHSCTEQESANSCCTMTQGVRERQQIRDYK